MTAQPEGDDRTPSPITLTIRLRCRHLPGIRFEERSGVRLGVQRGQEVVDDVAAEADQEVVFDLPVPVALSPRTGTTDFKGPFVHGKLGARFLYLCWGERQGEGWEGFRRAKVPLGNLSPVLLDQAARAGAVIETTLDMTDRRGVLVPRRRDRLEPPAMIPRIHWIISSLRGARPGCPYFPHESGYAPLDLLLRKA